MPALPTFRATTLAALALLWQAQAHAQTTPAACGQPATPIAQVQGASDTSPLAGTTVTVQGVVVGDFEGPSGTLRGFYLQSATPDADPATSEGIFVFSGGGGDLVSVGQLVRVTGAVSEYQGQTQISTSNAQVLVCGTASVAPTDVMLPFADAAWPERYEGMLVRLPQLLTVTEHFQLGRFGQVVLSVDGRQAQPTNVVAPGAAALALEAANRLGRIILDDALQTQNPDPIVFGRGGQPLAANNTLRGGDTASGIVGVMTYTWAGNSASGNAWRVRPVGALGGTVPAFQPANPRPSGTPLPTAALRVAGFNVLNFFNNVAGCTGGVAGAAMDCRGAGSDISGTANQAAQFAVEYPRQLAKTVAALARLDAAVVGLVEIENDGYGPHKRPAGAGGRAQCRDSARPLCADRRGRAHRPGQRDGQRRDQGGLHPPATAPAPGGPHRRAEQHRIRQRWRQQPAQPARARPGLGAARRRALHHRGQPPQEQGQRLHGTGCR